MAFGVHLGLKWPVRGLYGAIWGGIRPGGWFSREDVLAG